MINVTRSGGKVTDGKMKEEACNADFLIQLAFDTRAIVMNRIQQTGRGVSGKLKTKSNKKLGSYSKAYGKIRQKKGKQTAFVNLTFDGDLFRAFMVEAISPCEVVLGFADRLDKISFYLEKYYEQDIFSPTASEIKKILE